MTEPTRPSIRVGHAERDEAVERIREAAAEGRLSLEELEGRIESALVARTRDDLRALLADLLPSTQVEAIVNPAPVVALPSEPGWTWQDPLVLTARWDDVVRAGPWIVPPFLELNPVAANVKLDFTDARVDADLIDVHIIGGAGDAVLVLPEGWGADVSRIDKGMGSIKSTVHPRPIGRHPLLVVRGRTSMGTIKVRHPNRWDTYVRDRRLAKGGGIIAKN